ncbi:bifunctional folylpolyglutamate synthase/dihydrofolate synthase [Peribacillus cavernae]|uniref:tetrahydrofolate synthase n=1 Tax=Peribacillus cavernae TaxID=1674310 RepID=A0A433HHE2_9BACI|nr:folylpolyglutamate synthase/dihydrofolate synthase family protein [Peribacillus cavernae]MDQ0219384.1 dihydrofolate synthase/folylpolyglutamate synthase [Peribacillus cavernae]RUQ27740.1 bifunctional folylpolyglutamate synthase/dihydrofolate synthase [Peribacillus cavernae]
MKNATMEEINEFLHNRQIKLGMDFGLSRMETLLGYFGDPHLQMKAIHIAGSNGKGSTLNYLKEMLLAEGLLVGAFTSPYLECVNEQFSINNSIISDEEFIMLFDEIDTAVQAMDLDGNGPTQFEILTALAILYFKRSGVDLVLLETGLGGRLDSTNVVNPILSIITSISLEHTDILGNSIEEIAGEKAGIIKKKIPVISGVGDKAAAEVIQGKAVAEDARLYQLDKDFFMDKLDSKDNFQLFSYQMGSCKLDDIELAMLGRHQAENASLAVTAILLLNHRYGYSINEESIRKGLLRTTWRARFELLSKRPPIVLDGAHNPAGMAALLDTLERYFPDKKYRFVFTALKDKNYQAMIALLDQTAAAVNFTEITHERAAKAEELFEACRLKNRKLIKDWQMAIEEAISTAAENEVIIITGSLYFLSLARPYLLSEKNLNS